MLPSGGRNWQLTSPHSYADYLYTESGCTTTANTDVKVSRNLYINQSLVGSNGFDVYLPKTSLLANTRGGRFIASKTEEECAMQCTMENRFQNLYYFIIDVPKISQSV
jgi:hypothetical protein